MMAKGANNSFIQSMTRLTRQYGVPFTAEASPKEFDYYSKEAEKAHGRSFDPSIPIGRIALAHHQLRSSNLEIIIAMLNESAGMMPEDEDRGQLLGSIDISVGKRDRKKDIASSSFSLWYGMSLFTSNRVELIAVELDPREKTEAEVDDALHVLEQLSLPELDHPDIRSGGILELARPVTTRELEAVTRFVHDRFGR